MKEILSCRCDDNIKIILKKLCPRIRDCIIMSQNCNQWQAVMNTVIKLHVP